MSYIVYDIRITIILIRADVHLVKVRVHQTTATTLIHSAKIPIKYGKKLSINYTMQQNTKKFNTRE